VAEEQSFARFDRRLPHPPDAQALGQLVDVCGVTLGSHEKRIEEL
jgi:hypothetical protein